MVSKHSRSSLHAMRSMTTFNVAMRAALCGGFSERVSIRSYHSSHAPQRWKTTRSFSTAMESDHYHNNDMPDSMKSNHVVPFLLADIGEGIKEVEVLQWFVKEGDSVQEFDTICQVQSDKATVEITSRFAGKIVQISENSKIQVGDPLVYIETGDPSVPDPTQSPTAFTAAAPDNTTKQSIESPNQTKNASTETVTSVINETVVPFLLADIGEGIKEVEVLQWFVQEGDEVQEFDTICQVQSDKATVDITSRFAGTIVRVESSTPKIQVGQPLVHIRTISSHANFQQSSHSGSTALEQQQQEDHQRRDKNESTRLQIPSVASHYVLDSDETREAQKIDMESIKYMASPAVRKLAADHQINIHAIQGTGPQGRILKSDLLPFIPKSSSALADERTHAVSTTPRGPTLESHPRSSPKVDTSGEDSSRIVTLTGYNKFMVQTMTDSLQIPHMGLGDEIVVDKLLDFRKDWNSSCSNPDEKLGLQTLLIKACSLALKDFPSLNAKTHNVIECQVCVHSNHDIGVAMDTPHGLVVPVIRNVQDLSLFEIQQEMARLKEAAANGTTELKDLSPSPTFVSSFHSQVLQE